MKQAKEEMIGICGLYCGTCPNYLAYRENDVDELQRIAGANNMPVAEVRCDGCLSGKVMPFCRECRHGFRQCARENGVTWCFECSSFPCERLKQFSRIHVVNGIHHHAEVISELEYMKEHGTEAWLKKQADNERCPKCGKRLYWFVHECPECNTHIR